MNWIKIEGLIPSTVGGFTVREVGVIDSAGDLIAIGKYPATYKPTLGDIFWADVEFKNIKVFEGIKPILIIQNNIGNKFSSTTIAILIDRPPEKYSPLHVLLEKEKYKLKYNSVAKGEYITVIDKSRLKGKISSIDEEKMREIEEALTKSIFRS